MPSRRLVFVLILAAVVSGGHSAWLAPKGCRLQARRARGGDRNGIRFDKQEFLRAQDRR